ncbi:MAG: hypothetical protein Ct9H300mP3_02620 [Gammaproteobacteria bacterium]|nr:MAG: hypothetical protein Ct9H300mP3_02620 [Gammaproteobacteria bacterium]
MKNKLFISILFIFSFSLQSEAKKEVYGFANDADQDRFYNLVDTYRCPKCQSSNLAGSNAPIAKDLKREIHRLTKKVRLISK